jgi:hypothetical protein
VLLTACLAIRWKSEFVVCLMMEIRLREVCRIGPGPAKGASNIDDNLAFPQLGSANLVFPRSTFWSAAVVAASEISTRTCEVIANLTPRVRTSQANQTAATVIILNTLFRDYKPCLAGNLFPSGPW